MHAYSGNVGAEALLHVLPRCRLKWLAGIREGMFYTGGRHIYLPIGALHLRIGHSHHLVGNAVCLLLVFVSRLADGQLPPKRQGSVACQSPIDKFDPIIRRGERNRTFARGQVVSRDVADLSACFASASPPFHGV